MSVIWLFAEDSNSEPKRAKVSIQLELSFSDEDKVGTIQPHDDALVMVDQGSGVEIMYPNLYKGLN